MKGPSPQDTIQIKAIQVTSFNSIFKMLRRNLSPPVIILIISNVILQIQMYRGESLSFFFYIITILNLLKHLEHRATIQYIRHI